MHSALNRKRGPACKGPRRRRTSYFYKVVTRSSSSYILTSCHPLSLPHTSPLRTPSNATSLPLHACCHLYHHTTYNSRHRQHPNMTRTHKGNDRDHVGLANGTAAPEEHLPRYFAKSGFDGIAPTSVKKQGSGKGNWGQAGVSELEDYDFPMTRPKRRSNSSSAAAGHSALKTKFEDLDADAIVEYDEDLHGPSADDQLEKMSTSSSADTMASVEEEDVKESK